jgi:hypothetical protein
MKGDPRNIAFYAKNEHTNIHNNFNNGATKGRFMDRLATINQYERGSL